MRPIKHLEIGLDRIAVFVGPQDLVARKNTSFAVRRVAGSWIISWLQACVSGVRPVIQKQNDTTYHPSEALDSNYSCARVFFADQESRSHSTSSGLLLHAGPSPWVVRGGIRSNTNHDEHHLSTEYHMSDPYLFLRRSRCMIFIRRQISEIFSNFL